MDDKTHWDIHGVLFPVRYTCTLSSASLGKTLSTLQLSCLNETNTYQLHCPGMHAVVMYRLFNAQNGKQQG